MRRLLVVLLAGILVAGLTVTAFAQEKAAKPAKQAAKKVLPQFRGRIVSIDKSAKTMQLRKDNLTKTVIWADDTKWTNRNKKLDAMPDLKEGADVIVLGETDKDGKIVAQRVDLRYEK